MRQSVRTSTHFSRLLLRAPPLLLSGVLERRAPLFAAITPLLCTVLTIHALPEALRTLRGRTGLGALYGPCLDAEGVALDPLPQMLEDGTIGLVRVGRKRFLGQLMASKGERTAS